MNRRITAVLLTAALFGCTAASTDDAADTEAAKASEPTPITQQQVDQSVADIVTALRAGDAAAVANGYTADGVFISARGRVDGTQAIQEFWTNATKDGAGKNLDLKVVKWGTSGDLAWSLSEYTGGITAPTGHALAISQRQADGTLKIVAQVSIPSPVQ